MATQAESQANIQSLLDQGVSQSFIDQFVGSGKEFGGKVNPGERTKILDRFRADASNVFSTANINGPDAPRPDDLLGIRSQIQQDLGIPDLTNQFQESFGRLNAFDQATDDLINQIEDRRVGLSVIRGAQSQAQRTRGLERGGLARELQVTQSALQAARQEANEQFGIREADVRNRRQLILSHPGAGITFADTPSQAAAKIQGFQRAEENRLRQQAREDAEEERKRAYKDQLKAELRALGKSTGGSRRELERRLKKANKSAFERAERLAELEVLKAEKDLRDGSTPKIKTSFSDIEKRVLASELIGEAESAGLFGGNAWEYAIEGFKDIGLSGKELKSGGVIDNAIRGIFNLDPIIND
jgi:hypothetical protein